MKKKEQKEPLNVKKLVFQIVLWSLGVAAILLILLWDFIFKDKPISQSGAGGFVAIGEWFKAHYDIPVYTVVVVAIVILLCALVSLYKRCVRIKNKKAATVSSLVTSLLKWAIIIVAVFLIMRKWGVDTAKILASIGILALIIGLGCQSLISDIVAGIFLVADNAFEVGDIVVIDGFRGTVIEIGLKTTKIEDAGGNVKLISNSAITSMVNLTNSLSLAIVEISIPYEENLARTETLLMEHLKDMQKRIPSIVEGPFYKGVEDMGDSAVILKVIAKVKEEDRFQATRDMKRDIYIFLNDNAITVPYPQLTITQGPNPADHPEWVDKAKEEAKAQKEMAKQQEESKGVEQVNEVK
ncbi:MAG: mechanosensitive ion channel family protein [Bacilli bacterium]|nr:mechanosensitive ion channel family protein [Bacilli bacterium]